MKHEYDVFVSYSTKDQKIVERIVEDLRSCGVSVWFDDVPVGKRIRSELKKGIKLARSTMIIISKSSIKSDWVQDELDTSMEKGGDLVFPVVINDVEKSDLPLGLEGRKFFDLRGQFKRQYEKKRKEFIDEVLFWLRFQTNDDVVFSNGDRLVEHLALYHPTIFRSLDSSESEEEIYNIGSGFFQTARKLYWSQDQDEEDLISDEELESKDDMFKTFQDRYGTINAAKLALFVMEREKLDFIKGVHQERLADYFQAMHFIMTILSLQPMISNDDVVLNISFPKDGSVSFGLFTLNEENKDLSLAQVSEKSYHTFSGTDIADNFLKSAIESYEMHLSGESEDFESWFKLAGLYVSAGMQDKALSAYDRIVEKNDPDSSDKVMRAAALFNRSNILYDKELHSDALASLELAIETLPSFKVAYLRMAEILESLGDHERAQKTLQAYENAPDGPLSDAPPNEPNA